MIAAQVHTARRRGRCVQGGETRPGLRQFCRCPPPSPRKKQEHKTCRPQRPACLVLLARVCLRRRLLPGDDRYAVHVAFDRGFDLGQGPVRVLEAMGQPVLNSKTGGCSTQRQPPPVVERWGFLFFPFSTSPVSTRVPVASVRSGNSTAMFALLTQNVPEGGHKGAWLALDLHFSMRLPLYLLSLAIWGPDSDTRARPRIVHGSLRCGWTSWVPQGACRMPLLFRTATPLC